MKTVIWKKTFRREFKKLSKRQKSKWFDVFKLFLRAPRHRTLRRHKLKGKYEGLEIIDVTPDLRVLFVQEENEFAFYHIRNHNQLYR